VVSYDLNYRDSLWRLAGGKKRAQEINRRLAPMVDVMLGDFSALGFPVAAGADESLESQLRALKETIGAMVSEFPFKIVATTVRKAKSATLQDSGAICYSEGKFHQAPLRTDFEVFDCVGAGDAFASGLIYGLLSGRGPQSSVELGAAHCVLTMTTPGDNSMVTLKEVLQLMQGGDARLAR